MNRYHIIWLLLILGLVMGAGAVFSQQETDPPAHHPSWTVVSTLDTDLITGAAANVVLLAPSGEQLAHIYGPEICLYTVTLRQQQCIELGAEIRPDQTSLRWSPDSRYLTFSEDFYRLFVNSAIWLVDLAQGEVRPLTEDVPGNIAIGAESWPDIDLLPRWSPDGTSLYFLRLSRVRNIFQPAVIYRFDDLARAPVKVGKLHDFGMGATYVLAAGTNQLAYNVHIPAEMDQYGVWMQTPGTDHASHILHTEPMRSIVALEFSPAEDMLITLDERISMPTDYLPEDSPVRLLDLVTGEHMPIDPQHFVMHGGWHPEGIAFAYLVYNGPDEDANGLYISHEAGIPGERVLSGDFYTPNAYGMQSLTWAAHDRLLLGLRERYTALLVQLAQE